MNTSQKTAISDMTNLNRASSAIATPVKIDDIDFGNNSSISDANGERIIVCNTNICNELISLINAQHSYSAVYDNENLFKVSSEIWDQTGYLEYDLALSKEA